MTNENQVLFFALILLRIIAFVFSAAVFSSQSITIPVKVLFSLVLSFLIFSLHQAELKSVANFSENIISLSVQELFIGLVIGLITRLFFFTVSMAGDLISTSMGLNTAQIFNPISGSNSNAMEQFQILLATLVFFSLQGHHLLIQSMSESFNLIPVAREGISFKSFPEVVGLGGNLMEIALKMSAPIVISIFIINITMGILGRAVPQLNVLMTSLSVTLAIGILILIATLPLIVFEMNTVINLTGKYVFQVMRGL